MIFRAWISNFLYNASDTAGTQSDKIHTGKTEVVFVCFFSNKLHDWLEKLFVPNFT